MSPLFPGLSILLNEEDLSAECLRNFTDVRPYVGDFASEVLGSELVRIVDYPIMVPAFKTVEKELREKEFVFNER